MNTYTVETPRTTIALCAIALTAATIGVLVVAPSMLPGGYDTAATLASRTPPASVEVAISPARIDVIAIRAPNVAWAIEDKGKPNCKPEV
jgi:hypothetical protein